MPTQTESTWTVFSLRAEILKLAEEAFDRDRVCTKSISIYDLIAELHDYSMNYPERPEPSMACLDVDKEVPVATELAVTYLSRARGILAA